MPSGAPDFPAEFAAALDAVRAVTLRPELTVVESAAPRKLAPFAAAVEATVSAAGEQLATGRLILLYDPAGHESWAGRLRLVTYIRTELEAELVTDPLLPEVAPGWLEEALARHGVSMTAGGGTVTRVQSHPFGELGADDIAEGELEIRASWTPAGSVTSHVQAWLEALCSSAGLPPTAEDVRPMPGMWRR